MKLETTIRRTDLTVEKTETLRISRTRRVVYDQPTGNEQKVNSVVEEIDLIQHRAEPKNTILVELSDSTS